MKHVSVGFPIDTVKDLGEAREIRVDYYETLKQVRIEGKKSCTLFITGALDVDKIEYNGQVFTKEIEE